MTEMQLRAAVCDAGRRLWQQGLAGGATLSVRLSAKRFLVTPDQGDLGHLKPDEIAVVDSKAISASERIPSAEAALHVLCYSRRPEAESVISAKPTAATAIGLTGDALPDNALPEAARVLGSVPTVPYFDPMSAEESEALGLYLEDHKAFLLAHNGALVLGKTLADAARRLETLERVSQTVLNARMMDGVRSLPAAAFNKLLTESLNGELN